MASFKEAYKTFVLKHYWIIMPVLSIILLITVLLFGIAIGHTMGQFCWR